MDIIEMTVTVKWHRPSNGDLPNDYDNYYVITKDGKHKIMRYNPNLSGKKWEGDWGSESMLSDDEIERWTETLV